MPSRRARSLFRCCGLLPLFVLALLLPARPQTATTGAVLGTVTDPSGAAVPKATVEVQNTATGAKQSTITDARGEYSFPTLAPGVYSLVVRATGFQAIAIPALNVEVDKAEAANVRLTVGSVSQTVQVSAGAAHVQLQTAGATMGKSPSTTRITRISPPASRSRGILQEEMASWARCSGGTTR